MRGTNQRLGMVLALLAAFALAATPARAQEGQAVDDPIPEEAIQSGLGLQVKPFTRLPASSTYPAPPVDERLVRYNRINYIGSVPDGSGRMYVPDLNGKLYMVEHGTPHEYLDVGETFKPAFFSQKGLGQGFGFVAFHPQFKRNGRFYTVHVEDATQGDPAAGPHRRAEHDLPRRGDRVDGRQSARQDVPRQPPRGAAPRLRRPDPRHPADRLPPRGPAGRQGLRAALHRGRRRRHRRLDRHPAAARHAPGQAAADRPARSRTAPTASTGSRKHNPFVGKAGALGEIYALGFRDPHRFSWDPKGKHQLFLGHIGEHAIEAVDEVTPGANFGWSEREGPFVFDKTPSNPCDRLFPLPADDATHGYTYPVAAYDHDPPPDWNCTTDVGHGIIGGFVYRGRNVPELRGKYVFADLVTGGSSTRTPTRCAGRPRAPIYELMLYDEAGKRVNSKAIMNAGGTGDPERVDPRFGRDADGELYLLSKGNGKIWKITGTRASRAASPGHTRVGHATGARRLGAGDAVEVAVLRRRGRARPSRASSGPVRAARSSTRC